MVGSFITTTSRSPISGECSKAQARFAIFGMDGLASAKAILPPSAPAMCAATNQTATHQDIARAEVISGGVNDQPGPDQQVSFNGHLSIPRFPVTAYLTTADVLASASTVSMLRAAAVPILT